MSIHEEFRKVYEASAFGVKTRVFKVFQQQTIQYILKHPNYQDTDKIQSIINCIKEKSEEVLEEVRSMDNQINSIRK